MALGVLHGWFFVNLVKITDLTFAEDMVFCNCTVVVKEVDFCSGIVDWLFQSFFKYWGQSHCWGARWSLVLQLIGIQGSCPLSLFLLSVSSLGLKCNPILCPWICVSKVRSVRGPLPRWTAADGAGSTKPRQPVSTPRLILHTCHGRGAEKANFLRPFPHLHPVVP